jgi:phosphoserine phosphatase
MSDAFQRSAESVPTRRVIGDMSAVLDAARAVAGLVDPYEVLEHVVHRAAEIARAELASCWLVDEKAGCLRARVSDDAKDMVVPLGTGVVGHVAQHRETVVVNDTAADPRFFAGVDEKTGFVTRNLMALPLLAGSGRVVGVLQILNKVAGDFSSYDRELMEAFAGLMAVLLDKAQLAKEQLERRRLEAAMALAQVVQERLLPRTAPTHPRIELAGRSIPAESAGGDYFDFLETDAGTLLVMADATGHGVGPALLMASARAALHVLVQRTRDPGELLTAVNEQLCRDTDGEMFMTLVIVALAPDGDSFTYALAGHQPPVLLRRGDSAEVALGGLPAGILEDSVFETLGPIGLESGDTLFLGTDGLWEASDPDGNQLGIEPLLEVLHEHAEVDIATTLSALFDRVDNQIGDQAPDDDRTAIIARVR